MALLTIDASGGVVPPNETGYVQDICLDGQDWSQRGNKIEFVQEMHGAIFLYLR